jgi:hypothetical protein
MLAVACLFVVFDWLKLFVVPAAGLNGRIDCVAIAIYSYCLTSPSEKSSDPRRISYCHSVLATSQYCFQRLVTERLLRLLCSRILRQAKKSSAAFSLS